MSINKVLLSGLLACSLSACSRDLFISHNGNMPTNERIEQVKVGQSKNQVKSILGSPSSVVSLDKNTWIYMSSDIERIAFLAPKEVSRDVLTIKFDEENNVIDIDRMSQKDGKQVAINEDKTETMGQQQGFFRRFFGGVGSYMPFPGGSRGQNL
ncbi:MAG: outer membrane protein assembly factor BamE [Alphaproteobacteria bacterium]|mgnify:FL=1|jgi:outer membrane protein assembly factor BamE (lipoprotein component of BamABCDE complex)